MTTTELANISLGHIGCNLIQSLDEESPQAEHCNRMWVFVRDALLRQRQWNFAMHRVSLSRLEDDPAFGWAAAYALPEDYILAVEWNGQKAGTGEAKFDIEDGKLLCDDIERAELRYVRRITATQKWDANFCEAFTFKLAAAIAPAISSSSSIADSMLQKADAFLLRAFGPDNVETRPAAVLAQEGSGWLKARMGASN
ncbi:hypothetical protein UFOVP1329_15 [uncultured Caudovirales phage]|uniref:Uncharacterized protein n=1 Tax=uncultured Caudovirales phage TaxID=2100421 RepID=A0A6J5QQC2_9CAUD|nr:hypothetical protein UFOVP1150_40 [uncultured Caudovirales phage]CAB4199026.1 hypothetical protein UFOVP1329_15 [uncultured Caudovirales phage]CAB4218508.1 hypothetical protein UFOVP1595_21 [uncultured Caudovirales phage]